MSLSFPILIQSVTSLSLDVTHNTHDQLYPIEKKVKVQLDFSIPTIFSFVDLVFSKCYKYDYQNIIVESIVK